MHCSPTTPKTNLEGDARDSFADQQIREGASEGSGADLAAYDVNS